MAIDLSMAVIGSIWVARDGTLNKLLRYDENNAIRSLGLFPAVLIEVDPETLEICGDEEWCVDKQGRWDTHPQSILTNRATPYEEYDIVEQYGYEECPW